MNKEMNFSLHKVNYHFRCINCLPVYCISEKSLTISERTFLKNTFSSLLLIR